MIILLVIGIIFICMIGVYYYVISHPQILIGKIQKALYKGNPINSFEPFHEAARRVKEDGSLYVTEIEYAREYPNSYLDITYPTEDTQSDRATVIYLHGGGYFGGDKALGDPMAVDDNANRLFEEIVSRGYNFVNVNYALVPDHHFPVPLIQLNQAINYLAENADHYGLNMKNVIIFGQSAGAILASQYGALLTNADYRREMNIEPALTKNEIKALVIDDAPLQTEKCALKLKLIIANYLDNNNMKSKIAKQYNAYLHVNDAFPPSFMTAGNTDGFPGDMKMFSDKLTEYGIENEYYFRDRSFGDLPHGYLNLVKENQYARECFDHILAFLDKHSSH